MEWRPVWLASLLIPSRRIVELCLNCLQSLALLMMRYEGFTDETTPFFFSFIPSLIVPQPVADIQLLQFLLAPAGGANSDKSFGRALRDDLRPRAVFVSTGSP